MLFTVSAQNTSQYIDVVNGKSVEFNHFWSTCVGAGRANEGLRASWLEQLQTVHSECGFKYCRFHGLLHDDMFVYNMVNGKPFYNFQYVDDLFDRMLKIDVKPFVELAFMPTKLSSGEKTIFWWKGNTNPPADYDKWADLVTACVTHWIDRYGLEEVRSWYFEVWNEPNLNAFWTGTKSEYFKLYNYSAKAIKTVDKKLRVGGPATSNFVPDTRFDGEKEDKSKHSTATAKNLDELTWQGVWIKDFLQYCKQENLPVDFVSTHPYPTDWALDPASGKSFRGIRGKDATQTDMQWLNKTIKESAYPNAEIHLTEWSSSPSPRDNNHDRLPAAAFIIRTNLQCIGLTNSLSYWTFTDVFEEGGAGNSIFHGGFGMINYQGIVKPAFHAYRMLNQLGDLLLNIEEGLIVTKSSKTGKIIALAYHYPNEVKTSLEADADVVEKKGNPKMFELNLKNLKMNATFQTELLNKEYGYAYPLWKKMGSPEPPTHQQTETLKKAALSLKIEKIKTTKGIFQWKQLLNPWECVIIKEQ
jgi:xylan 1,4-beta-xylosidase